MQERLNSHRALSQTQHTGGKTMSNQDLTAALREFQEYKRIREEADNAMKTLQAKITAHMAMQDVTEMVVDVYRVSYKPVTSTRLNTTALKAAKPDIFAQFSTTTTARRFVVA